MRLFIAIPLPEQIQDALDDWQQSCEQKMESFGFDIPGFRWVPRENRHVTVLFMGDVDEKHIPKITKRIEGAVHGRLLSDLIFKEIRFAPFTKKPRMIWAEYRASEIQSSFYQRIIELMQPFHDQQPYSGWTPHITLARCRSFRMPKELELPVFRYRGADIAIKQVELWRSELSSEGSKYSVLHSSSVAAD